MAEPDALLIDALTRLTQQGGYEAAGEQMYPGLYPTDPSLAPMPSFDGARRSMGGLYGRGDAYGGGPLGGAGLLGGLPRPSRPNMDTTPGELDVAAAEGGWIPPMPAEKTWPDYGVPPILPPGPLVTAPVAPPPGPVDLSKIPSDIPQLVPSYPGPQRPPNLPFPSYDRGDAGNLIPRPRPTDIPSPSYDRGDAGNLITPYVPPPQAKAIKSKVPVSRGVVDPPGAITDRTAEETANIETSANNAKDFLQGIGYFDDGPFGFAQSLMLMYGGGLEPTVTQGPAVPYRERGQPMTTDRYLNFATGGASVPSILPEGQRLGQVAPSGDVATAGVGTGGAQRSPSVVGINPSQGKGIGGEGATPFQTFLENQDNAGRLIPGGLNLDAASLKGTAAINQLRAGITERDFEGVDSFEKFGNLFETKLGLEGIGDGVASFIQEFTGMQESDLRGPGLWNTLNSPIPMLSTGGVDITPLDVITLIAGGLPALGPILMSKFMDSLFNPITSSISNGVKGLFSTIFGRGGGGEVSQADINKADLDVLAEELGISNPVGTIDAGTYYGADGSVLATNMKSLDFGLHTADGANSFKDVLNNTAIKVDSNYVEVKYNYETGQVDVIHADGTVTESASYITTDSEGNMSQGTSANKKTSKKVNWGVNVVGVESIDTVAPRRDKGKSKGKGGKSILDWIKDIFGSGDDDDDDRPPEGSKG
jgi:hypothetical protein